MKKTIIALFMIIFATGYIQADKGVVILIKGIVTDPSTGKPSGSTVRFTNSTGKVVPSKINSTNGDYQQVLQSGEKYLVSMEGYIIPFNQRILNLPLFKEYTEYSYNINPVKIETGMVLLEFAAFEPNSSDCSSLQSDYITDLKTFMINNKNISIDVSVSSGDTYFKAKKIRESYMQGKRKKTRMKTISVHDQQQELIEARTNSLKEILIKNKIREKNLNFIADFKQGKPLISKKSQKSKKGENPGAVNSINNVIFKVGKILNM
jgi:hypothetical protein